MRIDRTQYSRVVVLTGAGISVASGLRPYRGPNGVWEEHDVEQLGHVRTLQERPADTWRLFGAMREPILAAQPNAAHRALVEWEASISPSQEFLLVTQNIDGLHQMAGSRNVCEIHGNIMFTKCSNLSCTLTPFRDEELHQDVVPTCPVCGSALRPDIVLFGEELPALPSWTVKRALRDCDLFLAVGTSGMVAPASNYVRSAEYAGARTVYVNLEPMQQPNPAFQEQYFGRAEELLPQMLGIGI
ncbi:SIR2 family NAD-dependent protein deacylase [Pantanalinema sp. GBBB05]|uniref:SIR2 family NAD-dependent protein deacylase n=1 Tax=Pantanalinema sp. GBBB05 TaxID=2604139 RepID=UPI001DCAB7DB|nr:NAD-dependent deacylase [Pantanalinema sp. GBBB05]